MDEIDFRKIEEKWIKSWDARKVFEVKDNVKSKKGKFYVLDMFPYPSGAGLHMGHAFVFSLGDIYARFKRLQGYNVLYPIGYDSLGLPAENAAIKAGTHPKDYTEKSIKNFMKQQKAMGWSYDWSRMLKTSDSDYYKWDQWIFLKMLEKGIAYRKKAGVNWCAKCETVLANEQVVNGKCWRHEDTNVEVKHLEQWFFRITDYAEELLDKLDDLKWPETAKKLQKNWIGKSYGTEVDFEILTGEEKGKISNSAVYVVVEKSFDLDLDKELKKFGTFTIREVDKDWGKFFKVKIDKNKEEKFIDFVKKNILAKNEFGGSWYTDSCGTTNKVIFRNKVIDVSSRYGAEEFFSYGRKLGIPESQLDIKITNKKISWPIFTTRVDTIYGVTFMVVSLQHPRLMELVTDKQKKDVEKLLKKVKSVSEKTKGDVDAGVDKEGVFTGSYAVNPLTNEKVPIYAGNFVVSDYATGMVMAVPAHDQRDYEFAMEYSLPIKQVIDPIDFKLSFKDEGRAYQGDGRLVNSGKFDDLENRKAIEEIQKHLEKIGKGRKKVQFKLRDWLISRQRYWGTPIPIVYCDTCGVVPVKEKDLPVKLPDKVVFGKGNPLLSNEKWIKVKCPSCGKNARRETDTMDTFVNSSWYFLRYADSKNSKKIFDVNKANYWAPIDQYIGGPEHITMHLIYTRFYTKFLRDLGLLNFDEPALKYFTQGIVKGTDGEKMSKSRGNVIEPLETINKYGADTLRFALVSFASSDKEFSWDEKIVIGSQKFLKRVYSFGVEKKFSKKSERRVESKLNKSLKEIASDVEEFRHNIATIKVRQLFDYFVDKDISKKDFEKFLVVLSVYCPFICEELWSKLGNKKFISLASWPKVDESKIDEKLEREEEQVDKLVSDIANILKILKERGDSHPPSLRNRISIFVIPNELEIYLREIDSIKKRIGNDFVVEVKDIKEAKSSGKVVKAKPGKPGILVE